MAVPIPAGIRRDGLNMSQGEAHAAAGKISPCSSPRVGSLPATIHEELPQEVGPSRLGCAISPHCPHAHQYGSCAATFGGCMHRCSLGGADCISSKRWAVGCKSTMQ